MKFIDIVANMQGVHKYSKEFEPMKDRLRNILHTLIIDKEMSIDEIKSIIKTSIVNQLY